MTCKFIMSKMTCKFFMSKIVYKKFNGFVEIYKNNNANS